MCALHPPYFGDGGEAGRLSVRDKELEFNECFFPPLLPPPTKQSLHSHLIIKWTFWIELP